MNKYSSKMLSIHTVKTFIESSQSESKSYDGILLLTAFGIVYGKFHDFHKSDSLKSASDILLKTKKEYRDMLESKGSEIFNDGSAVTLDDAVIKYSSGLTLNMKEIIIFCDQIIGFYPVDLKTLEEFK